jgi:transposase
MRCRHRVSKLLLLHGRVYPEPTTWNQRHRRWLGGQHFDEAVAELAYLDTLAAVDGLVARKAALDERLSRLALEGEWAETVARLRCFRGIDTLSALVLALEIGNFAASSVRPASRPGSDWRLRSTSRVRAAARARSRRPARANARRLLVEAAWQYLREPRIGVTLRNRQAGQPAHVLQVAWRAQHRLYQLQKRLRARGKPGNVTTDLADALREDRS